MSNNILGSSRLNPMIVIIIILIIICGFLLFELNLKNSEISEIELEYQQYKLSTTDVLTDLNRQLRTNKNKVGDMSDKIDVINTRMIELETENKNLTDEYVRLKWDIASTINQLENYKKEVSDSMEWFKENSNLDVSDEFEFPKQNLRTQCFRKQGDVCKIKTACLYLINDNMLHLDYQTDRKITESQSEDKLQSIVDFYGNLGGDCEDYSLFFKAEMNYIVKQCQEMGSESLEIETYISSDKLNNEYIINFNENKQWMIKGTEGLLLDDGYIYPSMVCGNMIDPNTGQINGHCVLAFTDKIIKSKDDISFLDNAPMIEPQDGRYLGRINDDSGIGLGKGESYIWQVVTDSDLYLLSQKSGWIGYSDFTDKLSDNTNQLRQKQGY